MIPWQSLLLPALVLLAVPVAIIPGYRRSTGSIIVSGALTTSLFAAFWLILGGIDGLRVGGGFGIPVGLVAFYGGLLLTLVTWALSLNAAAQSRRWVWVALLFVAGYLTFVAVFVSLFSIQPCVEDPGLGACTGPDPLRQGLIVVGYLACPVAALVYGIRAPGRRVRELPEGLTVSSLRKERSGGSALGVPPADDETGVAG